MPTVEKIRAAKAELKKLGAFEINNNAELTEWAHTRRCSSADELDAVVDFDRLLVLNTFYRNITIEVEEIDADSGDTVKVKKSKVTMGMIVATKWLLLFLKALMMNDFEFALQTDGTYRLHEGGWTTADMGTHNVKWAKRQYVHNFFAFMFMFCYTECEEAYHAFMTEFMTLPVKFFRMAAGSVPKVYSGSLDRSPAIANAYISAISACIVLLQCWPHISRKFKEGDFRKYFNMVDNMAPIEEHVTKLHFTQTDLMFRWLGKVLVVYWTGPMKEGRWATKFFAIYMEGHWGHWHLAAAGRVGIVANQNGIESVHKSEKVGGVQRMCAG